jgi:hypothetical protein
MTGSWAGTFTVQDKRFAPRINKKPEEFYRWDIELLVKLQSGAGYRGY